MMMNQARGPAAAPAGQRRAEAALAATVTAATLPRRDPSLPVLGGCLLSVLRSKLQVDDHDCPRDDGASQCPTSRTRRSPAKMKKNDKSVAFSAR